jgi:hypothetical protein
MWIGLGSLFLTLPCLVTGSLLTIFTTRPPAEFIPPVQEPYQYIIFRASEVKDLAVDEPAPMRSVHDDPAVLGVRVLAAPRFLFAYLPTGLRSSR